MNELPYKNVPRRRCFQCPKFLKHARFFLLVLFLLPITRLSAQNFDRSKMDRLFAGIAEKQKGMGSISLFKNGQEIYQYGFGYADVEKAVRPDKHTRYRIGSVTKMFTATVVMQLVDEKKLSLNTPLSTWFPNIPHAGQITIASLLRHHSGLSDKKYLLWRDYGKSFKLSKKAEYANVNYVLLSEIAEQTEHKKFADILRARIFEPCGLADTYYGNKPDSIRNEASSYVKSSGWKKVPPNDLDSPAGAGAIVSTPTDMNIFLYNLFTGKLVTPDSLQEMERLADGYGMGMMQVWFMDKAAFSHAGAIDGFQSRAAFFPAEGFSIAYSFNGVDTSVEEVLIAVLRIYFSK